MNDLNQVTLTGKVGKDPEIRHLNGGSCLATFSLATSESWKPKDSDKWEEKTTWHNLVAWNKLAERVEKQIKKGDELFVQGKIVYEKYETKNGETKYATKIVLEAIKKLNKDKPKQSDSAASEDDLPF